MSFPYSFLIVVTSILNFEFSSLCKSLYFWIREFKVSVSLQLFDNLYVDSITSLNAGDL